MHVPPLHIISAARQVANHVRSQIRQGRWGRMMPGTSRLAEELGVARKTAIAALRLLEVEGLLAWQGQGKKRIIERKGKLLKLHPLKIAVIESEDSDLHLDYMVDLLHQLRQEGHAAFATEKTLMKLKMDVNQIRRYVKQTPADAWVVAGAARNVMEWFSTQPLPVFSLFGRREGLPIAGVGPDKLTAYRAIVQRLIRLGHQRIVLLTRSRRRLPKLGAGESVFRDELAAHGIITSSYNFPDWEENINGFRKCLESLFQVTPPTALLIDEKPFLDAVSQFLLERGIRVPGEVSLICTDYDPHFDSDWCKPTIAHIHWDSRPVVRRVVRWAANVSCGKPDIRQSYTRAEFVSGGTIGFVNGK